MHLWRFHRVLVLCAKLGIGTVRPQRPTQQQAASSTIARLSLSSPLVNVAGGTATPGTELNPFRNDLRSRE